MFHNNKKQPCPPRGNALFLILIAVALFAALSYAVTQSGRGGGNISNETAQIAGATAAQKVGLFRQGLMRMNVTGLAYNQIRLTTDANENNTAAAPSYPQTLCSTGTDCLWSSDGGGIDPSTLDLPVEAFAAITSTNVTGHRQMFIVSGNIIGNFGYGDTAVADRLIFISNVKKETCAAFNKGLGVTGNADMSVVNAAGQVAWCYYATANSTYNIQILVYG